MNTKSDVANKHKSIKLQINVKSELKRKVIKSCTNVENTMKSEIISNNKSARGEDRKKLILIKFHWLEIVGR